MLIGREAAVSSVLEAMRSGTPVGVVGEAGIGKTALIREAVSRSELRIHRGGGLSTLTWMDHLPLVRALGRPMPQGDTAAIATSVCERIDGGVLVLDDLQWADHATMETLPFIAGRVPFVCAIRQGDPRAEACLEALARCGCAITPLSRLEEEDATRLVEALRPDLTGEAVRRIAEDGKGNPLLIEQLAVLGADAAESQRLGLLARLRPHGDAALRTVASLSLLGRPAGPHLVHGDSDRLVDAGLLERSGDSITLHHELLGAAALEALDASVIRELHAELASRLDEPGEAARHHALAGNRACAFEKAMAAASAAGRQSERAAHLALAARVADGERGDHLRLEAAEALVAAGDYEAALHTITPCSFGTPDLRARAALVRVRAHRRVGNPQQAEAALAEGLEATNGSRSLTEVELHLEQVDMAAWDWDAERAYALATDTLALARANGTAEARAELGMANACIVRVDSAGIEHARRASELAERQTDWGLQCEAECVLVETLFNLARIEEAVAAIDRAVSLAKRIGARSRLFELEAMRAHIELFSIGRARAAIEKITLLLREPLVLGIHLVQTRGDLALGLALTGDDRAATAALRRAQEDAASEDHRASVAMHRVEAHWLAGRPLQALTAFAECERYDTPFKHIAATSAGWAAIEVGRTPPTADTDLPPIAAGVPLEVRALRLLAAGDLEQAEAVFKEAARAHSGCNVVGVVRGGLGAGIAAIQFGRFDRARDYLLAAEEQAVEYEFEPLISHVRRALRKAGVRRPLQRTSGQGELTAREHEVLTLVREGFRTREIAARLGVASSTVNSQIQSAMRKLGSPNRAHAALAATSDDERAKSP